MHDTLELINADQWAAMLPSASLAETTGAQDDPEACFFHLLTAMVDLYRGGQKETVGHYVLEARREAEANHLRDSDRLLQKIGLRVFRDERVDDKSPALWWIAVMNNHREIARMFENSKWVGRPGAPGAWSQMLARIDGAERRRLRFAKRPDYCVCVPWEAAFPPSDDELDADENSMVDKRDRE